MARVTWEPIKTMECECIHATVALMEQRVYLSDSIADTGLPGFRLLNHCCSQASMCNLLGRKCHWSYLNSDNNPFEDAPRLEERMS